MVAYSLAVVGAGKPNAGVVEPRGLINAGANPIKLSGLVLHSRTTSADLRKPRSVPTARIYLYARKSPVVASTVTINLDIV